MEKYHKQDVAPIEKENERDENYEASNPQIDSERTRNNYRFTPYFGKTYTEFINGRIKELGLFPRKDAVVMNSFVLGSDKTFFDGLAKIEQYNFFSDCYKFFAERYGEENIIAAIVHNDETTPHMHLNLMPVTKDGRLCSKQLFDKPQLQQLQTDFYESVGKRWGLQRGKEGSQRKHLSTAEFKAKKITRMEGRTPVPEKEKIIEQAESLRQENQVCFSAEEKERIMKNTEGDYVSLLSRDELCKTIPLSDERRALYTPYALEKEQVRCEKSFYMDDVNWFLKTEGWKSSYDFFRPVENTTSVTHDGMIWFTSSVNGIYGIRPVILIKD